MTADQGLTSLFAASLASDPSAIALVDGHQRMTYAQLDAWAAAVQESLLAVGVGPGCLVGISLQPGACVVAAILGVLRAGCGYLPLDPSYPAARLEFMAADADVSCVLADGRADNRPWITAPVLDLPRPGACGGTGTSTRVGADAIAYVIYTSGSTGTPKGIPVTHGNVRALLRATQGLFDFTPTDRWTLFHSYCFDFSVWEMWGALSNGATLVCVPPNCRVNAAALAGFLVRERITVLNAVPSVFRRLVAGTPRSALGPALRYVIFGGEAFDAGSVADWLESGPAGPGPEIINMYGITETTVHATYRRVTAADLRRTGPGTLIGTALPHLDVRLLDEDQQPVEPGAVGEMYIGGSGVAVGYLNRPDLTRERFPWLTGESGRPARYFRSGDLASWSATDGCLLYHGRRDGQVKHRGFRIELGEIESVLRGSPGVADGLAVLEEAAGGTEVLAAYVELASATKAGQADLTAIRQHLRQALPAYMMPARINVLDQLPRTASGKLDRSGLRRTAA